MAKVIWIISRRGNIKTRANSKTIAKGTIQMLKTKEHRGKGYLQTKKWTIIRTILWESFDFTNWRNENRDILLQRREKKRRKKVKIKNEKKRCKKKEWRDKEWRVQTLKTMKSECGEREEIAAAIYLHSWHQYLSLSRWKKSSEYRHVAFL